ncbi:MAG: type II secretion system F family protein [Ilumatobacteraceae bacterium]
MVFARLAARLGNFGRWTGAELVRPTLDEPNCDGNNLISAILILGATGFFIRRHRNKTRASSNEILHGELPELVDQLIVLLRAGFTPANAFQQLELWLPSPINGAVGEVNSLVHRGVRFSSAVVDLRRQIGVPAFGLVDAVIQIDLDGLATSTTLDRLSSEAHSLRRIRAESEARELPIRLISPMLCCILPSFVMLTVVPMLAGTLIGLRTHLG